MNTKVESLITAFLNELLQFQPDMSQQTSPSIHENESFNRFASKTNTKAYRSKKISELVGRQTSQQTTISEDYKLLSKSIEKLKNMEKDIDKSSGTYLRRPTEQDVSHTKSIILDQSSICHLDRSKSTRKRIFQ